jgi:hypothetical protein
MFSLAIIAILILVTIAFFVITKKPTSCNIMQQAAPKCPIQTTDTRDKKVISDQLYPPLNRMSSNDLIRVNHEIQVGNLYQNTNDFQDSFRLVGYLTNTDEYAKDAGGNNWKLFARMKDRNQGEFYIIPTNNNIDLKIPLTNDIIVGERLRDTYSIPNELRFKSAMLNQGAYKFTEIPKADLGAARYL